MMSSAWSWLGSGYEVSVMCLIGSFLSCIVALGSMGHFKVSMHAFAWR